MCVCVCVCVWWHYSLVVCVLWSNIHFETKMFEYNLHWYFYSVSPFLFFYHKILCWSLDNHSWIGNTAQDQLFPSLKYGKFPGRCNLSNVHERCGNIHLLTLYKSLLSWRRELNISTGTLSNRNIYYYQSLNIKRYIIWNTKLKIELDKGVFVIDIFLRSYVNFVIFFQCQWRS